MALLPPSLTAGVSTPELIALGVFGFAGVFFALRYSLKVLPILEARIFLLALVMSLAALVDRSTDQFLPVFVPMLSFFLAYLGGAGMGITGERVFSKVLFFTLVAFVARDIAIDLAGWSQAGYRFANQAWEVGQRGLQSSLSPFGLLLFIASLFVMTSRLRLVFLLGLAGAAMGLFSAIVMGQGRTAAIICAMGLAGFLWLRRRSALALTGVFLTGLLAIATTVLYQPLDVLAEAPLFRGIYERFAVVNALDDIDRYNHTVIAMRLLENATLSDLLIGTTNMGVKTFAGSTYLHNGFLSSILQMGLPVGLLLLAFFLLNLRIALKVLLAPNQRDLVISLGAVLVLAVVVLHLSASIFADWRVAAFLGLAGGYWRGLYKVSVDMRRPAASIRPAMGLPRLNEAR